MHVETVFIFVVTVGHHLVDVMVVLQNAVCRVVAADLTEMQHSADQLLLTVVMMFVMHAVSVN